MIEINLSEDEKDVLQELMNVAYGNATAIVADMLDAFASLSIPNIKIMNIRELLNTFHSLKGDSYFFSTQAFVGEFSGECAFFIDNESANNLAIHLELDGEEDLNDAILELTNILTSTLTTRLAKEMNTQVQFALPSISKIPLNEMGSNNAFKQYSQVIVIDTQLNFHDQKINGEIFILTKDGSIKWLKNQLNDILKTII